MEVGIEELEKVEIRNMVNEDKKMGDKEDGVEVVEEIEKKEEGN